jgi:hypothetical protein
MKLLISYDTESDEYTREYLIFVLIFYRVYTFIGVLGDVGGLQSTLFIFGTIIVGLFRRKILFSHIISIIFIFSIIIRKKISTWFNKRIIKTNRTKTNILS